MTAEERQQFEAFKKDQIRKKAEEQAKKDREMYAEMVDNEVAKAIAKLKAISGQLKATKESVIQDFKAILDMKTDTLKMVKSGQKSHTFTNGEGQMRVTIGQYAIDTWRDTVEEGIQMVRDSVTSLVKDAETRALVDQIMRLLAKDKAGNLKIRQILELDKLAADLNNEKLNEGIAIIKESHIPSFTKQYIRAEYKGENGEWINIPLGMTEV